MLTCSLRVVGVVLGLALLSNVAAAQHETTIHRPLAPTTSQANRLTYLDHALDPYYVDQQFPKLVTPQWVGEPGVDAVVVLAIDDMRDPARYESYLRPILDRLKQIDGRASVSIMTNMVDTENPQLQAWLNEGLSIEVHTADHPCPCLQEGDFAKAKSTYDRCVDQMALIPGNHPVAFRMPCCDSLNTPSPRFWSEIFNSTTPQGRSLSIDSSVFQVFTPHDPELPSDLLTDTDGRPTFLKYLPFPSFVNTIRNYPYPYIIGRTCWEFPCMVPSDWEAQHLHQPNNPLTVADMQRALDLTVTKQGVMNLVFHPHGWIRAEQIVELIDHADRVHGGRVKFMSFREAQERLDQHLLGGVPLRDEQGRFTGTQLLDLNMDGYQDVIVGGDAQRTRVWNNETKSWDEGETPFRVAPDQVADSRTGHAGSLVARFGVLEDRRVDALAPHAITGELLMFRYRECGWDSSPITKPWTPSDAASRAGVPQEGLRGVFRDLNADGVCEWIVDSASGTIVFEWNDQTWKKLDATIPDGWSLFPKVGTQTDHGLRFVDLDNDGCDDIVASDESRWGAYRFVNLNSLWSETIASGDRSAESSIPMIARSGTNNGAWFHSGSLWIQNEDTHRLPDLVDRMSLESLMVRVQDTPINQGMPLPRTPEESVKSIKVPSDLEIQLVASEPLISDPVAFDWGFDGKLWVVEMGDYPLAEDGGRVRVLTDEDGDGVYDRSTIFLDGLSYPNGIKVWREGVLITAAPDLIWAVDRDGDHRADEQKVVLEGFAPGNQQHRANGLRYGIDHRLYLANGDSGGSIRSVATGTEIDISGRDLWYVPDQETTPEAGQLGTTSGQTQFGRDRDDWQHWFGGNNANPMWHYVLDERYVGRNPFVSPARQRRDVSVAPGASPVYPLSPTLERFNELQMANRFTSACSPMIYRDEELGETYAGNAFICEPVHNLIHREIMQRDGYSWRSERPEQEQRSEFLASDDPWFRPVMARTGPDGALWIADMYRLVIEHPEWITPERQAQLDLRSGRDRGRIYRVVRQGTNPQVPTLSGLTNVDWAQQLKSTNGPIRDWAQQQLIWNEANDVVGELEALLSWPQATTRLHALATLEHLGSLSSEQLARALGDEHPEVRRWAIRFAEKRLAREAELIEALAMRAEVEEEPVVRLQLIASLGEVSGAVATRAMVKIVQQGSGGDDTVAAVIASSFRQDTIGEIADRVLVNAEVPVELGLRDAMLRSIVGWATEEQFDEWLVNWLPADLAQLTLPVQNTLGWQAIDAWRAQGRKLTPVASRWIENQLTWARETLDEEGLEAKAQSEQITALSLLGTAEAEEASDIARMVRYLSARKAAGVRGASLEALARMKSDEVADALIEQWPVLLPDTRSRAVDLMLSREAWASRLTNALVEGKISTRDLGPSSFDRLVRVMGPRMGDAMQALSTSLPSTDRMKVVEQYLAHSSDAADAQRGREVFLKNCANCHRLDAVGTATGPDLAALTNRAPRALLTAILDPNQAIEDKFLQYLAETDDGLQLAGVIVDETSTTITMVGADGKSTVLQRERLVELSSTGRSLMPDGLEAQIDAAAMHDLLAFLRSDAPDPKSFPGNEPRTIEADGLGVLRLPASHSRIYGPSAVFESTYGNIGWWSSLEDLIAWTVRVDQPGTYEVSIDYASADGASGDRVEISIGSKTVQGVVEGTGTWDDYQTLKIGTVELDAGEYEVNVRAIGSIKSALMDLRSIKLAPAAE